MSSFGARFYLAALGRWGSPDPLAAKYAAWSPYTYTLDNPGGVVDPQGLEVYEGAAAQAHFRQLQHQFGLGGCCDDPPKPERRFQPHFNGQSDKAPMSRQFRRVVLGAGELFEKGLSVIRNALDAVLPGFAVGTNLADGDYGDAALAAGFELVPFGMEGRWFTPAGRELTEHAVEALARHGFEHLSQVDNIIAGATGTTTQADGARVFIRQAGRGRRARFDFVVEGTGGIVTGMRGLTKPSLRSLARNYGWGWSP